MGLPRAFSVSNALHKQACPKEDCKHDVLSGTIVWHSCSFQENYNREKFKQNSSNGDAVMSVPTSLGGNPATAKWNHLVLVSSVPQFFKTEVTEHHKQGHCYFEKDLPNEMHRSWLGSD